MPEYLYPGVYVEEVDTGNKPIEGVSTSTVGFLGIAERGPIIPTFVTSYSDFVRAFGGTMVGNDGLPSAYLAYAVEGFFQNGGLRCWVARVTTGDATAASVKVGDMTVSAAGPGASGGQIGFLIGPSSLNPALFNFSVFYWPTPAAAAAAVAAVAAAVAAATPASAPAAAVVAASKTASQVETYDNLSASKSDSTYYPAEINGNSSLISVKLSGATPPAVSNVLQLLDGTGATVGSDGVAGLVPADFDGRPADPANLTDYTALLGLQSIDGISLLCCPDENRLGAGQVAEKLKDQCEQLKDRFAIIQAVAQPGQPSSVAPPPQVQGSKYCAFYYPWLNVIDPTSGQSVPVPPGGHIAGIYARSDTQRNVAKDPANEVINGIDSIQLKINDQTQAIINPIGVNCLRYFRGRGNLVWGGRTTASDPDWKYISVRRLFIYVEKSIQEGTQWAVFEPNDEPLWAQVIRSISDFLTGLWRDGMLQGATKEQAFFVRCDRTTMTQADIDNGRLITVIGIAPVKPAEFVIFRIGQWTGGSDVTES